MDLLNSKLLLQKGIASARMAIFEKAVREICQVCDLACTMLLIIASREGIAVAHVGDGAVVIKGSEISVRILSEPQNSEYVKCRCTSDE